LRDLTLGGFLLLSKLTISGLRGFATKQTLSLAQPTGAAGSGLTVVVGANNSGKSTIIEALRAFAQRQPPSFAQGRRNIASGDKVEIEVTDKNGNTTSLRTIRPGSSESEFQESANAVARNHLLVLPSRRVFNPYFARSVTTRDDYMTHIGFPAQRTATVDQFAFRLFALEKKPEAFNAVLAKVVSPAPVWSIDQMDSGQYFLKIRKDDSTHSSEGLGEGLVSLLFIIDALYDSADGDCIAIDEPELSLHPALQRKLASLLVEYSATRQIILATHSPYFTVIDALGSGATIARIHLKSGSSTISQVSPTVAAALPKLIRDQNNPHVLGLDAQEIFFIEDNVILLEGQEDVVFFPHIAGALCPGITATFYGWGVGGADKMITITQLLFELGFARVAGILDANKSEVATALSETFPDYKFDVIPANDVRTKRARPARPSVQGLLNDENTAVRPELVEKTTQVLIGIRDYLDAR
jgi:predicted ATP-dependent endonuclease of OLD family